MALKAGKAKAVATAGPDLTLIGGKTVRLRQRTTRDWSKAKARHFLNVLAETCNVSRACRESGLAMTVAYRRRKTDAAFRAGWLEAIASAYQRLEMVLLERAFIGNEKVTIRKDGSEERMREYSNSLGLTLLKMHRETAIEADTQFAPNDVEEIRARLIDKLERLRQRDFTDGHDGQ